MSDETQAAPASTHLGGDTAAAPAAAPASAPAAAPAAAAPAAAAPAAAPAPAAAAPAAAPAPSAAPAPAADDKEGKEGKDGKEGKEAGAPEKYEDFKLPEGMKADPAVMGEFQSSPRTRTCRRKLRRSWWTWARDAGRQRRTDEGRIEAQGEAWGKEALADKEFGGEKFEENLAVAKKGLDQFATPELKNLLVQTKLGNHPEVLRAFFRAGQAISEDGFVPGRVGSTRKSNAEVLYGNTTH
jgi:hypothetical protein